jgi:hypothetical protein
VSSGLSFMLSRPVASLRSVFRCPVLPAVDIPAISFCRSWAGIFAWRRRHELTVSAYGWLDQRDVLIVKADRQEALVVVRMSLAVEIAQATKPRII